MTKRARWMDDETEALEALACGTPVAAIGRGGLTGFLDPGSSCVVHSEEVQGLARAIVAPITAERPMPPMPKMKIQKPSPTGPSLPMPNPPKVGWAWASSR